MTVAQKAGEIAYLSGVVVDETKAGAPNLGVLITPLMGNAPASVMSRNPDWGILHAHDNGVWSEFVSNGRKPFRLGRFLAHLDAWQPWQEQCLWAAAPDVVGDWRASIERSLPVLPQIRERGYRAALVAQNGLRPAETPWDEIDAVFLGGGPDPVLVSKDNPRGEWKLGREAIQLAAAARERDKLVHMGRCNSLVRFKAAQAMGCTSADGTFLKYGTAETMPDSIREMLGWLDVNEGAAHDQHACYVCNWRIARWLERAPRARWPGWPAKASICTHQPRLAL